MRSLRKLWAWLNEPQPPTCSADWLILGWGEFEAYTHAGDCPVHGKFSEADHNMELERRETA